MNQTLDLTFSDLSEDDTVDLADSLQFGPNYFCREILGERTTVEDVLEGRAVYADAPWDKQIEIMESVRDNKRTAVRSSHNVGKTHISARIGLWFLYAHSPSVVITTAPKWTQVRDLLWARWGEAFLKAEHNLGGECLPLSCRCRPDPDSPNWFAAGYTAKEAESFQGYHEEEILFILDEAPGVPPYIWDAIEGMLSGENCRILVIGNPVRSSGPFYQSFRSSEWNKIHISSEDHPNVKNNRLIYSKAVAPGWPEERKREWGEDDPRYISRVTGSFPPDADGSIIPLSWAESAINREIPGDHPRVVGLDVARMGSNETVFCELLGRSATFPHTYTGKSTAYTSGLANRYARFYDYISVDDAGIGGAVVDNLHDRGLGNILPFHTSYKPILGQEDDFYNLGSQMWWLLRLAFKDTYENPNDLSLGISIPDDPKLLNQLTGRFYDLDRNGKIRVQNKDDYTKEGNESPDRADALLIAWYARMRFERVQNSDFKRSQEKFSGDSRLNELNSFTGGLMNEKF
jgi:phage terminase large subunit